MSEALSTPEYRESSPEREADLLVYANEAIQEICEFAQQAVSGDSRRHAPDAAPDALIEYCVAVAERDPTFGKLLVRKFTERSMVKTGDDVPRRGAVEQHIQAAEVINRHLVESGQVQPDWLDEEWSLEGKTFPDLDVESPPDLPLY